MEMTEIKIEIVYCAKAYHNSCYLPSGTSIDVALNSLNLYDIYPEISSLDIGIFSKIQPKDYILQNFDRIEIYSPLIADPKEQRAKRAQKKRNQNNIEKSKWRL